MGESPRVFALVLAAGSSQRFGHDKLEQTISGQPVWLKSARAFLESPHVHGVGVVTSASKVETYSSQFPQAEFVIEGGETRFESSKRGILAVPDTYSVILIHDAARPWVSQELIKRVIDGTIRTGAALPGIPITDTVRQVQEGGYRPLQRDQLVAAQTPQGALREHFLKGIAGNGVPTDDIQMLEAVGIPYEVVPGESENKKVTYQQDLPSGEIRTGLGYDVHAFSTDPNRPLWLGGVEFDSRPGLEGHSDADAMLHAVVDALLGAAGLGDIGQRYPNSDPAWKNCSSLRFLSETGELLRGKGWKILNVDACAIAERPKIMARKDEICQVIAQTLAISVDRVNVKATTNEGLGAIGREEGIACFATVTIQQS